MKNHIIFISVILFFTLMGAVAGTYAEERYKATGTSSMKLKSLPNALVSAHFTCNKKGLWAELDTLVVLEETTSSYKLAGSQRKLTEYHTTVLFDCAREYQKELPAEE